MKDIQNSTCDVGCCRPRPKKEGMAIIFVIIVIGMIVMSTVTVLRVSRNDSLLANAERNRRIARCAAQGAAHRGLTVLRRTPALRGAMNVTGPERAIGVLTTVQITDNGLGQIVVSANASFNGANSVQTILVDPSRL